MQLTEALQQSRCVETSNNYVQAIIERATEDTHQNQSYWWDIRLPQGRCHGYAYGPVEDILEAIYEKDDATYLIDGILETCNWQPTTKAVDWSDCTCQQCYDFQMSYHIIPNGVPWRYAAYLRCKWWLASWKPILWWKWFIIREKVNWWLVDRHRYEEE